MDKSIVSLIEKRRRQILIHSYIYRVNKLTGCIDVYDYDYDYDYGVVLFERKKSEE